MELYDKIQNIYNINKENEIIKVIAEAKSEYQNLTTKRTCVIYSSLIAILLSQKHISVRIINTKDLGMSFEHQFCLVPDQNKYYLIDLTFEQFNTKGAFPNLLTNGYMLINNTDFNNYLSIVTANERKDIYNLDDVFYHSIPYEIRRNK